MKNPADKVEQWDINKLVPYARNARTHTDEQVAQIAASIKEWGFTTAVLVDEDGGIIAGHGRTLAAQRLKMTEVPVMVAAGWSDAKKRAYIIADNKLALNAGWDNEMLALELGELKGLDFDLDLTGFSADEIAALMPVDVNDGLTDEDAVPEWPAVDKALRDSGFHWSSTIIWYKDQLVMSRKDYHTQYEPLWYGWKSDAARIWVVKDRKQSDVWKCDRPKNSPLHPTTKPVELIERAILNSSNSGVLLFEPFGGSGSCLIACEKTGRINNSMELDPKYVDVIIKRWQEFTGKIAVHADTNIPFAEVTHGNEKENN